MVFNSGIIFEIITFKIGLCKFYKMKIKYGRSVLPIAERAMCAVSQLLIGAVSGALVEEVLTGSQ